MSTKTIVIIGGGFAGTRLAQSLEAKLPEDWSIVLLSRENFITYSPLLPEVVAASLLPGHVVAPLRQMLRRTRLYMVEVMRIDLAERTVHYLGEGTGSLRYDHLVLACGQSANLAAIEGMASYALPLKSLGDSLFLRNRLIVRLEQAELERDPEKRRWLTTFIVIGGGFSGVELAGGLADFMRASRRYYTCLNAGGGRVHLLHGTARLMPEFSASLGDFACRKMTAQKIDVRLNARVVRVDQCAVALENGELISGGTIVCTVGAAPHPLIAGLSLREQRGRIEVAADMAVPSAPDVWAIGDCAAVPNASDGKISPPTAQFADRQARELAANIARKIRGQTTRPFSYKPIGQLCTIGHNKAVAELFDTDGSSTAAGSVRPQQSSAGPHRPCE